MIVPFWYLMVPNQEEFCVPVASGFVAGEALVAALIAITCTIIGLTVR